LLSQEIRTTEHQARKATTFNYAIANPCLAPHDLSRRYGNPLFFIRSSRTAGVCWVISSVAGV
jgi:hypothetical protein